MFWALAAVLALLVLAGVLYPLLRDPGRQARSAEYDLAVYNDQLAEVEHNREQGLIGEQEAEAARAEIGRRILEADRRRQRAEAAPATGRWPVRAGVAVIVAAVAGSFGMYVQYGEPGKKSVPFAERDVPKTREAIAQAGGAATQGGPGMGAAMGGGQGGSAAAGTGGGTAGSGASDDGSSGGMPDIDTAEKRLAERLEKNPENVQGWLLLARTRMQQQNYTGARDAFAKAHDLRPENTRITAGYAESIVLANQGMVNPKAEKLFKRAHAANPEDPQANHYLALADFQAGEVEAALERWKQMVANAEAGAPWLDMVKQHMAAAERQLDMEPGSTYAEVKPEPAEETQTAQNGGGQDNAGSAADGDGDSNRRAGPTQEQMAAAEDMSPEARKEMVRGMVDRLSKRLEDNPDDVEGWLRLARSYRVLEKPEKARDALKRASDVAPENVQVLVRYARAIRAVENKQTPKSLEISQRILELDGDHPEALWFVGLHEARQGNREKARDLFDKALAKLPDTPQTAELRRRAERIVGEGDS